MKEENSYYAVISSCPDKETARSIAEALIKDNLAKCVQIGGEVESLYVWKGKICKDCEIPISIKLSSKTLKIAEEKFMQMHPYECPEWVVLKVDASEDYGKWLDG